MVQLLEKGLSLLVSASVALILLARYGPMLTQAQESLEMSMLRSVTFGVSRIITESYLEGQPKQYMIQRPSHFEISIDGRELTISFRNLKHKATLPVAAEPVLLHVWGRTCLEAIPSSSSVTLEVCKRG